MKLIPNYVSETFRGRQIRGDDVSTSRRATARSSQTTHGVREVYLKTEPVHVRVHFSNNCVRLIIYLEMNNYTYRNKTPHHSIRSSFQQCMKKMINVIV